MCDDYHNLIKHLKEHLAVGSKISCPFDICDASFRTKSSFTAHLSRYHRRDQDPAVIDVHEENQDTDEDNDEINHPMEANDENYEFEILNETDNAEELYVRNLLLFYMKLESKYLLPSSTIQYIVDGFKDIHSLGQSLILKKLQNQMKDLDIPEDLANQLIDEVLSSDLLTACSNGSLRSHYMRHLTYKKDFNYVGSVTVDLGTYDANKKCSFEYIPIKESLASLFKNKSVQEEYETTRYPTYHGYNKHFDGMQKILHDVTDGSAFKDNPFFQENSDALRLMLYQDSFEVCNPLGSSKKKHKILAVYLTLANFRPHLRSNVDQMVLVLLCKEVDFKYFGQHKIFDPLISDLKDLEKKWH